MSAASSTLIQAVVETLRPHAPFGQMAEEQLTIFASRLKLAFYAKGDIILAPEQGVPAHFFVIKQGGVIGEQVLAQADSSVAAWQLSEGECFPLGALLANRPVASIYRAAEDTFCYLLPASDFAETLSTSAPFHDFCTRRLASLLERSKHVVQTQYALAASEQQSLSTPLASVVRQEPVICPPEASIRQALVAMGDHAVGSVVVIDDDGRPLGIFTLQDLLHRVALPELDISRPIHEVMSRPPIALPMHAPAYEAALAMARHSIRHVLVVEEERLIGLVSEKDLFSLQRIGLAQLSETLRRAASPEHLADTMEDVRRLARNMLAQGVAAEHLTQIISALNDLAANRAIELALSEAPTDLPGFCWIALGSEGRLEQTLSTDQDNGIIFQDPEDGDAQTPRRKLLPLAERINQILARCGFPLCSGGIMAGRPDWCLSLKEWKARFSEWIDGGSPEALLNATIFFDFRPLYGDANLSHALREWLMRKAGANTRFLYLMAQNALRNSPPLGVVSDFAYREEAGRSHVIDLKLNGTTPFVDGARIYALATGTGGTNTVQRLRQAGRVAGIPAAEVEAWVDAFNFIQLLRLRQQHGATDAVNRNAANLLDPDELNPLDRRILKEAFRQGRKLQSHLAAKYRL